MSSEISSVEIILPSELKIFQFAYVSSRYPNDIRTCVAASRDLKRGARLSEISLRRVKCDVSKLPTLTEDSACAKAGAIDLIRPNGVRCINWVRIANTSSILTEDVNIIIDKSRNCQVIRPIKTGAEIVVYPCEEIFTREQLDHLKASPESPENNVRVVDNGEMYRVRRVLRF